MASLMGKNCKTVFFRTKTGFSIGNAAFHAKFQQIHCFCQRNSVFVGKTLFFPISLQKQGFSILNAVLQLETLYFSEKPYIPERNSAFQQEKQLHTSILYVPASKRVNNQSLE